MCYTATPCSIRNTSSLHQTSPPTADKSKCHTHKRRRERRKVEFFFILILILFFNDAPEAASSAGGEKSDARAKLSWPSLWGGSQVRSCLLILLELRDIVECGFPLLPFTPLFSVIFATTGDREAGNMKNDGRKIFSFFLFFWREEKGKNPGASE